MKKAKLFEEDEQLFANMKVSSTSGNEFRFFEQMYNKQVYHPVGCVDIIMKSCDNEDGIYIEREGFSEYLVGRPTDGKHYQFHVMTLSDALNIRLTELGLSDKPITILDWLRERDFKNIIYDYKDEE